MSHKLLSEDREYKNLNHFRFCYQNKNWWIGKTLSKIIPNGERKEKIIIGFTFIFLKSLLLRLERRTKNKILKIQLKHVNLIYSVTRGNAKSGAKRDPWIMIVEKISTFNFK